MSLPTVAVVTTRSFSAFHISVPCMIFGQPLQGKTLFKLQVCAGEPGLLRSAEGMQLHTEQGTEALEQADIVIVPYWRSPEEIPPAELLQALCRAHQRGTILVGLCLGAYVLAHTGLLNGLSAATHWEFEQDFRNRFTDINLDTNALYCDQGQLITSAGTAAGLDCCLHIVRRLYGSTVANQAARRLVTPPHREGGQAQYIEHSLPRNTADQRINGLLQSLRENPAAQLSLDDMAARVMMSRRTFSRRFRTATGMSAGEWQLQQRLRLAQTLLEENQGSIADIARHSGFSDALSLRRYFRSRFGVTPAEWRRTFSTGNR